MQGSLVNRLMESSRCPEITPGMGATVCHYSDRSPATVVAIRYAKDGKTVHEIDTVDDSTSRNKAVWPAQDYDIAPGWTVGQELPIQVTTWRMDGRGRLRRTYIGDTGRRVMVGSKNGPGLALGDRDYYQDPSF